MPRQRFYGDWELICKDFMESGLSRSAYSKKKGIPMTTFCKKLDEYKYKKSSTEFIPVKVFDKTKAELTITIGMAQIIVREDTDKDLLIKTVKVLSSIC